MVALQTVSLLQLQQPQLHIVSLPVHVSYVHLCLLVVTLRSLLYLQRLVRTDQGILLPP
jgi:hypothetical protein